MQIKAYSKKELAAMYNVSIKVFNKWLAPLKKELGEYKSRAFTPKQVKIIIDNLDMPD